MSLMQVIEAGHQGHLFATVGVAAGVDAEVARAALERLLPPLARRLSEHAGDPVEEAALLDVIAGGGYRRYLEDPRALLGRDSIRNGEEALIYLYGSLEAARQEANAVGPPASLDRDVFARMMTLAASLLLAAMAQRREHLLQHSTAEDSSIATALKGLWQAALRGFLEGSTRAVRPLGGSRSFARLMHARRRKQRGRREPDRPSLDELLGDLVGDPGGRRKSAAKSPRR